MISMPKFTLFAPLLQGSDAYLVNRCLTRYFGGSVSAVFLLLLLVSGGIY